MELPPMPGFLVFHVVTSGRCWLSGAEDDDLLLQPGDLALVPHGEGHRLTSEPGGATTPLFELPREQVSERYELLRHGGGGAPTDLICGAVRFDHPAARHLVRMLPRTLFLEAARVPHGEWLQSTLRLMAAEASALRPGGDAVITRLADVLVIQALRAWIERQAGVGTGWLGALQDRQIGRALALVHREPGREWTVARLAREAAMSRSAFAARFTLLVGEPVMSYLTRWRLQIAYTALEEEHDVGMGELAARVGYGSEAAFGRAFKRFTGVSPGSVRRRATADQGDGAARRNEPGRPEVASGATQTSKSPGSVVQRSPSKKARSAAAIENSTRFDSPGASSTRRKPASSRTGRVRLATRSRT
jgi:AraC-like DNA-binding protein